MSSKRKPASHRSNGREVAPPIDAYFTIAAPVQTEYKIQGSKFISLLEPLSSAEEFFRFIDTARKEFHDATHHCYAYRLGITGEEKRSNDDGEPTGTAGKRILSALEDRQLTFLALIVVRYFGGTKLGIGGLSHAYSAASALAIEHAEIIERFVTEIVIVDFSSELLGIVHREIDRCGGRITHQEYLDTHRYHVELRLSVSERFMQALQDFSHNKISCTRESAAKTSQVS